MTKILVLDSEASLRDEVASWLILEGYEVISVEDSMVGVEYAIRHQPDLIICDMTMPRLDGNGVLLEIRANPVTTQIPFIFLTTADTREKIRQTMSFAADDYVAKPFTNGEFLQAVRGRLDKKEMQERNYLHEINQLEQALVQEHDKRLLKTKLVAMFAHDFRTFLTSILASTHLLRDYADRIDEARRLTHLNRVDASAHHLVQMLDDMLVLAQIESGNLEFKLQLVPVGQFLESIVQEFQAIYSENYHIFFENRFSEVMNVDPRLLRQIATNLISNAIKYSPPESEVRVIVEEHEGLFSLKVQDQGIGIPETDQITLFREFARGTNVGTVQGTGLGLAIVKQAVDFHGGSIQLESEVGTGTTITVNIPINRT